MNYCYVCFLNTFLYVFGRCDDVLCVILCWIMTLTTTLSFVWGYRFSNGPCGCDSSFEKNRSE